MKLAILILAVLGATATSALPASSIFSRNTRNLNDDLNDFAALLPLEEILEIAIVYLAEDEEVQQGVSFLLSDDFKQLVLDVEEIPEYHDILRFLSEKGLDVYSAVDTIHELLGLPAFKPRTLRTLLKQTRSGKGFRGLVDEIRAILPREQLRALYYEKLETSPDFAALVDLIVSDEFQAAVEKVRAHPTYQHMRETALGYGLDIDGLGALIRALLGLEPRSIVARIATRNLNDDLNDFAALLPLEEILEIAIVYLAEDEEVQQGVLFLLSDDFKQLILDVEEIPEYHDILRFLSEKGLDVYSAVDTIHELLDLPAFKPRTLRTFLKQTRSGKGFRGLVDEIRAILPREQLRALYYEKLETSPDFAALVDLIVSDEFQAAVEKVRAHPTYQHMRETALGYGLDIDGLGALIRALLGLEPRSIVARIATRNLNDDLNDFAALLPLEEILEIAIVYLAEDEEVQQGVLFLLSDDFKQLILDVEEIPEYHDILRFLSEKGLDVYSAVDTIHELLDLPAFKPRTLRTLLKQTRSGKGFRGLVDEIRAILPREQLRALYYEKLETSPDFAALVDLIVSDEFQAAVDKVQAHPTYQHMRETALAYGLDIDGLGALIRALLGLN